MKIPDDMPYAKKLRAPFYDRSGNTPKRCKIGQNHCWQVITLMSTMPESQKQGFIQLQRKIFGLKVVSTEDSAS